MGSTPEAHPAYAFEGYELGDISGTGLAGEVRHARHAESGVDVAVEVIGAPLGADSDFRQRLSAEVDRATVLDHPTIASVYEVLSCGEHVGVVTDSLALDHTPALQRDDGLPLAATLFIAEAVLLAMSSAHRAGVVHGAIEPRVISVEGTRVRVGGFGVGRAMRPQVPAEPATDTRAVARLVVDLTAGSAASRYATLPRQLRIVLARAASARRERQYRTAAAMRSALVDAARRDLGEDWRKTAAEQLRALRTIAVATAPPSSERGTQDAAEASPRASGAVRPVVRAAPGDLAQRRTTPARSLRVAATGAALVVLALAVGVAGGVVVPAIRGTSPPAPAALSVSRPVSLHVEPAQGSCTGTFVASATGSVHGAGTILYRWQRSDGEQTGSTALPVSSRDGSFLITQHWQLNGQVSHASITFELLSPVAMSVTRPLQYTCP
ncbi:MAG: hypothetical protein JOZ75_04330 [Candidatus Dormibacteraeota bacterium]|nr:hypothetical protein [Candidatus Dormibacteraeota bacterium]